MGYILRIQASFRRCVFLFMYIFLDVCNSFTVVSGSSQHNDVICDRRNQTDTLDLPRYCQNNGVCTLNGCSCSGGYYGTICQHSVINAVIVIVVCILPPASWTMVFCYGCKERRRKRRLRQERVQQRRELGLANDISPTLFAEDLSSDLPPNYYEISHDNPIALCSMDEAPWSFTRGPYETTDGISESPLNDPPPPDYNDVLKKAIESGADLPIQATQNTIPEVSAETPHSSNQDDNNVAVAVINVTDEILPSSSSSSLQETVEETNPPIAQHTPPSSVIVIDEPSALHTSQEDLLAAGDDEIEEQCQSTESQEVRRSSGSRDGRADDFYSPAIVLTMEEHAEAYSSQEDLIVSMGDEEEEDMQLQCETTNHQERSSQERTSQRRSSQDRSSQHRSSQDRSSLVRSSQDRSSLVRSSQDRSSQDRSSQDRGSQNMSSQNSSQERTEERISWSPSSVIIMDEHSVHHSSTENLFGSQMDDDDEQESQRSNTSKVPVTLLSLAQRFNSKKRSSLSSTNSATGT